MSPPRLLLVDNYDSFTWNLAQAFMVLGAEVTVIRNDQLDAHDAIARQPTHVCISPGPGHPADAGNSPAILRTVAEAGIPVLGVCLGHQMIGHVWGARVERAARQMHGKSSEITHGGNGLFAGCPQPMQIARYHSLIVSDVDLPEALEILARTDDRREVMAMRHRSLPVWGVQFHPESVLTPDGPLLLGNFLRIGGTARGDLTA